MRALDWGILILCVWVFGVGAGVLIDLTWKGYPIVIAIMQILSALLIAYGWFIRNQRPA